MRLPVEAKSIAAAVSFGSPACYGVGPSVQVAAK